MFASKLDDPLPSAQPPPDSVWAATAMPAKPYPGLDASVETDVAVVGAGFTGLHAALVLAAQGRRVTVIEANQPGWGASGRNGGQVIPGLHASPSALVRRYGRTRGERWFKAGLESANTLFEVIRTHHLECDALQPGYMTLAHNDRALTRLTVELEEIAQLNPRMRMIAGDEARLLTGSHAFPGALLAETGGSVHPLKLCQALAGRASELGAKIYGDTTVTGISQNDDRWRLVTTSGTISAHGLILASNTYTYGLFPPVHRGFVRVCSFQAATAPLGSRADHILPQGHAASDTRRLLHYFRKSPDGRIIMGGRAPFRTDVTLNDAQPLREGIAMFFPEFADEPLTTCWAGWVGFTLSHLPVLAQIGKRGFAVYGYNASGVALSSVLGRDAARLASGMDACEADVPIDHATPVPFHRFSRLGASIAIKGYSVLDRLGL